MHESSMKQVASRVISQKIELFITTAVRTSDRNASLGIPMHSEIDVEK
jgi:hypothetical protein